MGPTILIVEDEKDLAGVIDYALVRAGFQTIVVGTAQEALAAAARHPQPDLVLLDLMLPDGSGTEVCRRIRTGATTRELPVVMVTAKHEEIDRVVGFELGADDYVTKPFSVRELVLRIRAVLRRKDPAKLEPPDAIEFGCLRIDVVGHRVWVHDAEVQLTAIEFKLLHVLVGRRGRVQTRDTLLRDVWDDTSGESSRTIDTHVQRLRKKLGAAADYVSTLRGEGYRFRSDPGIPEDT
jgi:two-component system phosphate regulon response regulator PhoB